MNAQKRTEGNGRFALLFAVAYIAYSAVYVSRVNLSIATPVMESLSLITKSQTGLIGSVFFVTYSLGQLLNGPLGDKLRPKLMIVCGLALIGVSNALIGLVPPVWCIALLWGLNGYAQSMIWGPMLRTVSRACGDGRARKLVPFLGSSVAVGSVVGILLAQKAVTAFGVCAAFLIPSSVTLAAAVVVLLFFRDTAVVERRNRISFFKLIGRPRIYGMLLPTIAQGVIKDNIVFWAPFYFVDRFGVDIKSMSFYVFAIPLTSIIGRFTYPLLYKAFKGREHIVSIACFGLCIVLIAPLAFGIGSAVVAMVALALCAAAIAAIDTSMLSIFPLSFGDEGNVSSVVGLLDFATYMGAGISTAIYGAVLDKGSYRGMFASWMIICAAAIIVLIIYICCIERQKDTQEAEI